METTTYAVGECAVTIERWNENYAVFWVVGPDGVTVDGDMDAEHGAVGIRYSRFDDITSKTARSLATTLLVAVEIAERLRVMSPKVKVRTDIEYLLGKLSYVTEKR